MTESTTAFVSELRDELVAAAQRRIEKRNRRQKRALRGLAAVVAIIATTSAVQLSEKPSEASVLEVRRSQGFVTVDLKTTSATTSQIASELKRAGINASITELPVSPSGVGRFLSVDHRVSSETPSGSAYFSRFTLPDEENQTIDLQLGRPARTGEPYAKAINAYDKGELLHCSSSLGKRVREAIDNLHARTSEIRWHQLGQTDYTPADEAAVQDDFINFAFSDKPNSVEIFVSRTPMPLVDALDCV